MAGSKNVSSGIRLRLGRRRFLAGVGGGGLTAAAAVFGFATPASAASPCRAGLHPVECCCLYCSPSHDMAQCETGSQYYVWSCSEDGGFLYCDCCEHNAPQNGCNSTNYSSYSCQYG